MNPKHEQERHKLCRETITRIGKAWGDNIPDQPDMLADAKVEAAKEKLDATWQACRQDLATMDEFKAALSAWETENYLAISALKAVR